MAEQDEPILRRKLAPAGGDGPSGDLGTEALRRALARAARRGLRCAAIPTAAELASAELAAVLADLPAGGLVLTLEDAAGAPCGVIALDPGLAATLVETEVTGRVPAGGAGPRPPTDLDAAILGGYAAALLDEIAAATGRAEDAALRAGGFCAEPGTLGDRMPPGACRRLVATLKPGDAAGAGTLTVCLPAAVDPAAAARAGGDAPERRLGDAVTTAPLALEAVAHRFHMSLDKLAALGPGDRIDLPAGAIDAIALEAPGRAGVFAGRLGQLRGFRAVKIGAPGRRHASPPTPETDAPAPEAGSSGQA